MPLSVVGMSEASLPNLRQGKTRVDPISAIYELSIAGDDLKALRRLGKDGGAIWAIEQAIQDYIATNGNQPCESPASVLAAHVQAFETGSQYP